MESGFGSIEEVLLLLPQLIWPAMAIFQLVICLKAKERVGTSATQLMVVGTIISLIMSVANFTTSFGLQFLDWGYEYLTTWYSFSWLLSLAGSLLFLFGLYQFVNSVGDSKPHERF
ncbi:MAG: hypothetical protein AAGF89_04910 [Bacteroidota bacterium]